MTDVVSHKTAVALYQAGFPRPDFKPGQFWYSIMFPYGSAARPVLYVCCAGKRSYGSPEGPMRFIEVYPKPDTDGTFNRKLSTYAPTLGELLLTFGKENRYYYPIIDSPNPAEKAAEFWLIEHKIQP